MAEYKLSYTANEIDEKLGKIDELIAADNAILEAAKAYSDSKGGYVEKKCSPTVTVPFVETQYPGKYAGETEFNLDYAIPGDILTVVWDGTEYKAEVGVDSNGHNAIGNPVFVGGEDNGLPFAFFPRFHGGVLVGSDVITFDNSASHTIAICQETIVPIDPKYLPGVCLPVVELSTALANETALTDAESALLSTAFEGGAPVVIRCTVYFSILEGMPVSGQFVFNPQLLPLGGQSSKVFGGVIYGINVMFIEAGENWICAIEESA